MDRKIPRFGLNLFSYVTSLIIGVIIGYIGGPALALIWWSFIGVLIGWLSIRKKAGAINGAIYGFALSYAFMVAGYSGSDSVVSKLTPFIAFGLFGAICGACLGLFGSMIHRKR